MNARRRLRFALLLGSLLAVAVAGLGVRVAQSGYALASRPPFPPAEAVTAGFVQSPTPTPTESVVTPVTTVVAPATSIAEPHQAVVTPETNVAQAESGPASTDSGNDPPFMAIGIASGVAVAAIVLVTGAVFRTIRRRPQGD